jgi:integrase/recombinase XerC
VAAQTISEEELARVIGAAQNPSPTARHPWPELERALCALLITAGLRLSELLALRVGDIGRRAGHEHAQVSVAGKGRHERTVPLPPETVKGLDAYLPKGLKQPRWPIPRVIFLGRRKR